jgi:hypothetical protein
MKRPVFCVLLLLCTVSVFAIEGIGDFTAGAELGVYNVTGAGTISTLGGGFSRADAAAMAAPALGIEPFITFKRDFDGLGVQGLSLKAALGTILRVATGDTAKYFEKSYKIGTKTYKGSAVYDELYLNIAPSYRLGLGPGMATFTLDIKSVFFPSVFGLNVKHYRDQVTIINPIMNYATEQDFGTLGFELGTDDMGIAYGLNNSGNGYGLGIADLYFKALFSLPLPAGSLSVWASPRIYFKCSDSQQGSHVTQLRLDGTYTLNEMLNFGLEMRFPIGTKDANDTFDAVGLLLRPHVNADLFPLTGLPVSVWGALELGRIGAKSPHDELVLNVIIGGAYRF